MHRKSVLAESKQNKELSTAAQPITKVRSSRAAQAGVSCRDGAGQVDRAEVAASVGECRAVPGLAVRHRMTGCNPTERLRLNLELAERTGLK